MLIALNCIRRQSSVFLKPLRPLSLLPSSTAMADKKVRARGDESKRKRGSMKKKSSNSRSRALGSGDGGDWKKTGPRLPNAMRREVEAMNPGLGPSDDESGDEENGGIAGDVYEYEEEVAEEESMKNRRYDKVENFEYQLPEDFEDEDVPSDDEDDDGEEMDEGRHSRLLQEVTGMPAQAFEGKKRKRNFVASEAYPESEYNPTSDVLAGNGQLSIQDLIEPLHDLPGFGKLKKKLQKVEKTMPLQAPLPKAEQDRIQRTVVYEQSKKEVTKWEPLVKRNREAPTIYFDQNVDLGFSTVGAIASEFKPRTDFEKQMASLLHIDMVVDAEKNDGARLLELNPVTAEDVKDRQNRLAKMRSLLFRSEIKAKHIKKIKSKTYHRLMKKDKLKAAGIDLSRDPEAAKALARKQETERAKERMTLKHRNTSKWAKRILQRGLDVQDEGTRARVQEQLREHERLTRKMNTMNDSSSDDSSEEDDDLDDSDVEDASKLLDKAEQKTKRLMDDDGEMPNSSLLSLPFMARGLAKKKEAADEEAKLALQDYEALKRKVNKTDADELQQSTASGRRVFGATQARGRESKADPKPDVDRSRSDSEDEHDSAEELEDEDEGHKDMAPDVDLNVLREDAEPIDDSLFKTVDDIVKDPGPKTTYDVAIYASGSWKKTKHGDKVVSSTDTSTNMKNNDPEVNDQEAGEPAALDNQDREVGDSGSDSEEEMVDGILTLETKEEYKLPSQEELIQRAFAGDDVEEEFQRAKEEALSEEIPKPEEPSTLPGWGQWASVQKKRGLPSWMLKEHEDAKRKREEALKKRKDAQLQHVIISEKVDKKAEKLHTKSLPYPFTSKEVYEQSIRMPIGPESNPASSFRAMNRPEVVKRPGIIIQPISFEEVNPREGAGEESNKRGGKKRKAKGKGAAKTKTKTPIAGK